MRRVLLASSAALLVTLALAAPARAYVRSRNSDGVYDVIWPDPRVTMTLRLGGTQVVPMDDFIAAAMSSGATWSDPGLDSSVTFTVTTSADGPSDPAFDHENTIAFRTVESDPPTFVSGQLAVTTVWSQGGRIVDTDVEINAVDPSISWAVLPDDPAMAAADTGEVDLQNALTHELGHVIGLDHPCFLGTHAPAGEVDNLGAPVPSCSDPALPASVREATMFPSATRGSIGERTLSPDEVLALHDLYPAGKAPVVEGAPPPDSGGCAVGGTGATRPAGALVPALAFAAVLFARRRRILR
jgi:hypothetical protein